MYWASRLFVDVIPEFAHDTANRLVEYSDNPVIVPRTKKTNSTMEERRQAMKLTGLKSFLLGIALIITVIGFLTSVTTVVLDLYPQKKPV